ncbi:MAG: TonB-dependent receptor [Pseudomonadota bacterium]
MRKAAYFAVAAVAPLLAAAPAWGQSSAAAEVEELLVLGQRGSIASSVAAQRQADGVSSVLTRDDVGQFPDQNVAEAVRRAPGVNVLNDQGEGRFVAVRGLDPGLNAASINGVRVPAPESDVRSVALDVIPAELIESIEIKKSLTPDMDADTIGASIEINTTSAFKRPKPLTVISIEGSYNDATDKWSPKAAIDFSRTFGENLGVAGGLSYYKRKFATDNVEADGWDVTDGGIAYADTLEYRDYDVQRERLGGALSIDFRVDESTDLYVRGLYSRFDDQEDRRRLTFEMDEEPAGGDANTASFTSDDGQIRVERDIKDRFERQTITSLSAGGVSRAGPWTFEYSAAWAKAEEKEAGSLDPVNFRRDFEDPGDLAVTFDYTSLGKPQYLITRGQAGFLDASSFEFDKVERTTLSLSEDEEVTVRFDVKREFGLAEGTFTFQTGGKARMRDKTYDLQLDVFDGFDGDFTLADVVAPQTYGIASIDPVAGRPAVRSFFNNNLSGFELNPLDTAFEGAVEDYDVEEDIYAGYAMGRYEVGPLRLVGGVRVEHTRQDVGGNLVELVEEGAIRDGVELDEDTIFVTPTGFKRDYTDWLPSATLRYEAAPDVLVRAGVFRSIVRPRPGQIAPRFIVEENDDNEREGEFGNPDLKPYEAWNLDLSAEWYFARASVLSAGVFYKKVNNFIVDAEFEDGVFNGVAYDEALIPINGDKATIKGFELNYQQALVDLPTPFDGLLFGLNFTYTDAEGDALGRSIDLPASSKHTLNAMVGYEKGPVSLRVAASYRDKYLDELGGSADEDRYVEDHLQWDITARYRVNERVQVFGELINIGDEPYTAYQRGPGRKRLLQYEEYSWTGKLGLRATF